VPENVLGLPEDRDLSAENFDRLNRDFFEAAPHEYFQNRLNHLMLFAGRRGDIREMLRSGVGYRGVRVTFRAPADDDEHDMSFIALESEVLLHHAAETLLRLYLAHEGRPECPWLEMARVRQPSTFKERLTARFVEGPSVEDAVSLSAPVLLGSDGRADGMGEIALNMEDALRRFAGHFLRFPHLYNAAKHGFAVHAAETGSRLSLPEESELPPIETRGPAIQYLSGKRDEDRALWYEAMTFVELVRAMALTGVASLLIQNLWTLARQHYLGGAGDQPLFVLDRPLSEYVPRPEGLMIRSVRRRLLYEGEEAGGVWELELEWTGEAEDE